MNILVFSDSHGNIQNMIDVIQKTDDIGLIIHLGDLVKDAEDIEEIFNSIKVEYVAGNNDYLSRAPGEKLVIFQGKKILITHGNNYGVKNGYERIAKRAAEAEADVLLFGHTHIAYENYYENILMINPGSISLPARGKKPSYALLQIDEDKTMSKIYNV